MIVFFGRVENIFYLIGFFVLVIVMIGCFLGYFNWFKLEVI